MVSPRTSPRRLRPGLTVLACALAALPVLWAASASGQKGKVDVLRIGSSGHLGAELASKEKSALETLRGFIKEETGLNNEIARLESWQDLAAKMAKGDLQLGVFQGFEFAWAQEKHAKLKPLALAVNVYRYPIAYVVTRKDNAAKDFAGLKGQSVAIPATGQGFLRLFLDKQAEALGKTTKTFFSKISAPDNIEDALDDAVDGVVQTVTVDRAALEAFKQRKPGRFSRLKAVAHSQPFPPPVVAYYNGVLDAATRQRFREGLLGASKKEKGRTMLTLFHLTGFDAVPSDFDRVVAATRKAYPPPDVKAVADTKTK